MHEEEELEELEELEEKTPTLEQGTTIITAEEEPKFECHEDSSEDPGSSEQEQKTLIPPPERCWGAEEVPVPEEPAGICAVCFEEEPPFPMPCCGRPGSTASYCRRCIETICSTAPGGIGRCPSCRHHIRMISGDESKGAAGGVSVEVPRGTCRMCCMGSQAIVARGMCDACLLGSQYRLRYECSRCHKTQMIPHPMWRYQATPAEFGTSTWACHRDCDDFTNWRILPMEALRVPGFDCFTGWVGRREEWLDSIRERRRSRGQEDDGFDAALSPEEEGEAVEECCVLQ